MLFFAKSNPNRLRNAHANFGEATIRGCGDMFELGENTGTFIKGAFFDLFSNFFFAKSNSNRLRNAHANFCEATLRSCGDMLELGKNEGTLIKGVFFNLFLYFLFLNLIQIGYEMLMQILVSPCCAAVEICSNWGKMRVH